MLLSPASLCKLLLRVQLLFSLRDACIECYALVEGRKKTEKEVME